MSKFICFCIKQMGQDVSITSDINVISHIMHVDGKRKIAKVKPLDEVKQLKMDPSTNITGKSICIIICNSYEHSSLALGDPALNDGITTYYESIKRNYIPYLFHDITKEEFKSVLIKSLKSHADKLVVYYIGHGRSVYESFTHNEVDGRDECLVFVNGSIIDNELSSIVTNNNNCGRVTLISDCCHSGTIYDIPPRSDIITISACRDNESAKQDWIDHKGNGVFTYYFWKYIANTNDGKELQMKVNNKLQVYGQQCVFNYIPQEVL